MGIKKTGHACLLLYEDCGETIATGGKRVKSSGKRVETGANKCKLVVSE